MELRARGSIVNLASARDKAQSASACCWPKDAIVQSPKLPIATTLLRRNFARYAVRKVDHGDIAHDRAHVADAHDAR
jgi:hypothetical protein